MEAPWCLPSPSMCPQMAVARSQQSVSPTCRKKVQKCSCKGRGRIARSYSTWLWLGCVVILLFTIQQPCHAQSSSSSASRSIAAPTQTSPSGPGGVPTPSATPSQLYPGIIDLGPPDPNGLELGIILPLNLSMSNDSYWRSVVIGCITAVRLAVEDINKAGILPLNITLSMRNSHPPPGSRRQDGSAAMMSAAQLVSHNVSALIGDTFSWLTAYSASMTSALHIPQCSFSSISDDFSSKILYGYFIRTAPIGKAYCDVYLQYVRAMGWRRIGLVYTSDGFGLPLANEIVRRASSYGIQIVHWEVIYLPTSNATAFTRTMDKLRELGSYVNLLLTTDAELLRALEDIHHAGMFQLPYHWITLNNVAKDVITYFSVPGRPSPSNFNGLVMLDLAYDYRGDPEYDKFYDRWLKLDPQQYPGAGPGTELNYYQTRAYSCAQILALGYRNDIERARKRGHNDTYILEQLRVGSYPRTIGNLSAYHFADVQYHGPVGKIVLNHEGDPESGSWVFYQLQNNKSVVVARSDAINSIESVVTIIPGAHHWPGYDSATPPDGPNWVLQNLRWKEPIAQTFALIATFGVGVSFIVMGIVIWKRKDPVIKASSPYFCVIEIAGIILVYFTIPLRIGNNRVASCMAMPLIIVLGSTLLLGSLVVKNFRIYRIFSNVFYNKYAIKNSILARQMVVILIVCMAAPILYVITTRPVPTYTLISPTKTAFLCLPSRTDVDNYVQIIFMVFMVIPNLVLLIIAGYLAYSTQHVASNWNQAKAMAYTIYNILFASLICVPTMFFPNDLFRVTLIIQNSIILLAATVSLLVLFGPKLLIMRQRALRARKQSGSSSSTGYNHSSYSQSNSYSQSSSGNGRKDQSATVDRDFCRSRGSAEFSSSPCPHTASGTQQHLPQPTDERDLTAGTTSFGLQHRSSPTSIQTGDGRSHSSAQSGSAGEGGSSPPPLSGRQSDITSLDRGKTSLTTSPYSSSYRTDYFQHPRATLAAMEPVDPLGPGSNFVQLTPLPPPLDGSIGEPQQFDAIRFRTGILGRGHNGHPHNEFDLHVPEEDQVTGHNPHRMAMLIDKQGRLGAGTIPVLVQDMRHFFLRAFSRWRAMRVIVVSSLGMVMLIDPKKVKTETFLYTNVVAVTERRHFFLRVTCEQGYELQLEYPCAQARDLWLRSFTTMGTIHDSNQLNPLRHRHNVSGSSNVSNNNSDVAINQQNQQPQYQQSSDNPMPAMDTRESAVLESGRSSTPTNRGTTSTILASAMKIADVGRTREHRDSNGSETPLSLSTLN